MNLAASDMSYHNRLKSRQACIEDKKRTQEKISTKRSQ
jgi:hypothetical protein